MRPFERVVESARVELAEYHAESADRPVEGNRSSAWWAGRFAETVETLLVAIDASGSAR